MLPFAFSFEGYARVCVALCCADHTSVAFVGVEGDGDFSVVSDGYEGRRCRYLREGE